MNRPPRWLFAALTLAMGSGALAGAEPDRKAPESLCHPPRPDQVWVVDQRPLSPQQATQLSECDRLLVMIPGVSSGDLAQNCRFLEEIRMQGGHPLALFYDWENDDPSRGIASPLATSRAADRLLEISETYQGPSVPAKPMDVLAHSAGTIVLNKTAERMVERGSAVRFRHVLFLGTAVAADASLEALQTVSDTVLNVHSANDKVNRNVNDADGLLSSLTGGAYRNVRMDYSLSGRIMRHYVSLSSNPENWFQYGTFLRTGSWPEPEPLASEQRPRPDIPELHRAALWVRAHPEEPHEELGAAVPRLLAHDNPEIRYYAVILAGLLGRAEHAPALMKALQDRSMPAYLRKEIYQAIGSFEDGRYVDFLRDSRDRDPACDAEIRDVVRELKRKRIEPIR